LSFIVQSVEEYVGIAWWWCTRNSTHCLVYCS